jgi:hypothetical protein
MRAKAPEVKESLDPGPSDQAGRTHPARKILPVFRAWTGFAAHGHHLYQLAVMAALGLGLWAWFASH